MRRLVTKSLALTGMISLMSGCMTQQVKPQASIDVSSDARRTVVSQPVSAEDIPKMELLDAAMRESDHEGASTLAHELLEKYPNNASLHINLGVVDLRLSNYEDALVHLDTGCVLDPQNIHCPLFKGQALLALARYDEAEEAYLRALSLDDKSLYAHYGLGVIYDLYLMDYALAEDHYQAFIDGAGEETKAEDVKRVKMWKRLLKRKSS